MVKNILWVMGGMVLVFACFVIYTLATTRNHSPAEIAQFKGTDFTISIEYCRPFKKGRNIFGDLLPYDTYWRTGANEPTIVSFSKSFVFGNQKLSAGKYRLYSIPRADEWEVVLNSETEKWGAFEPDYSLDVARMTVATQSTKTCVEQFLIDIKPTASGLAINMSWDQTKVILPIEI
jgi:hypothetical protein